MCIDVSDVQRDVAEIVVALERVTLDSEACSFTLSFHLGDRSIPARLTLGRQFPAELPEISIDPGTLDIPHIETSGKLCYREPEGLSISLRDPHAVMVQALRDAHELLSKGLEGSNRADIIEELGAYWAQHCNTVIRAALTPGDQVKALDTWYRSGQLVLLTDRKHSRGHLGGLTADAIPTPGGLYVPVAPLQFDRPFLRKLAAGDISPNCLFSRLNQDNARLLAARLNKLPARVQLVLGVGEPEAARAVVGLEFDRSRANRSPPVPFRVRRVDRGALLPRAGSTSDAWMKRVVLIGCGALGGHVAMAVARMGISELTLVDPDSLAVENIYRHTLGLTAVGAAKAEALAERIAADLPHVRTSAMVARADEVPERPLRSADLVIVTIGDPTVHRDLNRRLHPGRCRVVFGWLEPLGIGGHALLTGAGAPGCLECLFLAADGSERLSAWTDLASPNQTFARRHFGCAGAFTPFADLDARRTADLVAELIVHARSHPQGPARLRSWRGETDDFLAAGYLISHFGTLTPNERELMLGRFMQSRCPVCGR